MRNLVGEFLLFMLCIGLNTGSFNFVVKGETNDLKKIELDLSNLQQSLFKLKLKQRKEEESGLGSSKKWKDLRSQEVKLVKDTI